MLYQYKITITDTRGAACQVLGIQGKIPKDYASEECRKFLDDLCAQKEKELGEILWSSVYSLS